MIIMEKVLKTILWAARLFDKHQQPVKIWLCGTFNEKKQIQIKRNLKYKRNSMCQAEIEAELSPLKDLELLVHPWILRPT